MGSAVLRYHRGYVVKATGRPGGDFAIRVTRVVRYADGRTVRQPRVPTYDRLREPE
jgi:hypothetical protein